jgi:hypothetical protein
MPCHLYCVQWPFAHWLFLCVCFVHLSCQGQVKNKHNHSLYNFAHPFARLAKCLRFCFITKGQLEYQFFNKVKLCAIRFVIKECPALPFVDGFLRETYPVRMFWVYLCG